MHVLYLHQLLITKTISEKSMGNKTQKVNLKEVHVMKDYKHENILSAVILLLWQTHTLRDLSRYMRIKFYAVCTLLIAVFFSPITDQKTTHKCNVSVYGTVSNQAIKSCETLPSTWLLYLMNFDRNILPKSIYCSFDILHNILLTPEERKRWYKWRQWAKIILLAEILRQHDYYL